MSNTEHNYQETDLGNVSPNPRGEYDPSTEYEYLDLVSYQGGSYLCLAELGAKITGTAPEAGKNTECWQMLTLPGDLTSEYIAMHDDVVVKAKQAEASRLAAELAQQTISDLKTDVQNAEDALTGKISKFYATNNGEKHLADSDDGKIADMMVYGRSEQKSTTGAQLINTFEFKAIDGVLTIDEDGGITLANNVTYDVSGIEFDLSTLEKSQYTFKNYSKVGYYVMLDSVDYSHLIQPNNSFTFTKTDFLKILGENIQIGKSANFKCMLEKGSEAHTYEPYTGGKPSPSPDYPQEIKSVVNPTVKVTNEDGLKVQSVTLNNITLNAIPVPSGGNVTIDGQQYIADCVDVERGKLVRMIGVANQDAFATSKWESTGSITIYSQLSNVGTGNAIVNGTWKKTPKKGALIIFRNGAHIGSVRKFDTTYIYTNEGNTSSASGVIANGGTCRNKKYKLTDSAIDGYVWIDYGAAADQTSTATAIKLNKTPKYVAKVTATELNVRSWAGTENPKIKKWPLLKKGNLVDVCDTIRAADKSKWNYIRIAGKYYGFVAKKYLKKQ